MKIDSAVTAGQPSMPSVLTSGGYCQVGKIDRRYRGSIVVSRGAFISTEETMTTAKQRNHFLQKELSLARKEKIF